MRKIYSPSGILSFYKLRLLALLIISGVPGASLLSQAQSNFTNVADSLGVFYSYNTTSDFCGGISFCDWNGDGRDDLSFGSIQGDSLYIYTNDSTAMTRIYLPGLETDTFHSRSLTWADYDNDGDKDLFVTNERGINHLFRYTPGAGFSDFTQAAGLDTVTMYSYSACWGDYDRDGWLDLYVVNRNSVNPAMSINRLYHNEGDGTFTDATAQAGVGDTVGLGFSAVFFDYDNDGWSDLYIANDKFTTWNRLYHNEGNGTFTDVSDPATTGLAIDGMGIAVGDYDENGYLDIYVTNTPQSGPNFGGNVLLKNNGNGTWAEVGGVLGVRVYKVSWGANFMDFDNDGDEDLFVMNGAMGGQAQGNNSMFVNQGGTFLPDSNDKFVSSNGLSFGSSIGDLNNDGYYDLAVMNADIFPLRIWRNNALSGNNWVKIDLQGVVSNRDAIGVWVEYWIAGVKRVRYTYCGNSFASQHSGSLILGAAGATSIDSVVLRWPSGIVNVHENLAVNQRYWLVEDTGEVVSILPPMSGQGPALEFFPNPTEGPGSIRCFIPGLAPASLDLTDLTGKKLRSWDLGFTGPGHTALKWDGRDEGGALLPGGIYFLRLSAGGRRPCYGWS